MIFNRADLPPEAFNVEWIVNRFKVSLEEAQMLVEEAKEEEVFLSSTHQVNIRRHSENFVHLSIKRIDKSAEHDWRILQDIKNSLVGPESEAVELYPAEDRLVDTSNQYHLWVLTGRRKFPELGWDGPRRTMTPEQAAETGAVQRAFS